VIKTTELMALESARNELAEALDAEAKANVNYAAVYGEFKRNHQPLIALKAAAEARVSELTKIVQGKAVAAWQVEKVKKLTDGIGIQERTQVDYDDQSLFEACLKYAPMFLQVNEKAIKALGESAPNEGKKEYLNTAIIAFLPLTIWQKPTPTIGVETLIELHKANAALRVVEVAGAIVQRQFEAPQPVDEAVDLAVDLAAAALDAVGAQD